MAKSTITISIDNDVEEILTEMQELNLNRSAMICDLLRFLKKKDFRIPKGESESGPVI